MKKGDRVISINGKDTAGLTHAESVEMLKVKHCYYKQRHDFIFIFQEAVMKFDFVLEDGKEENVVSSSAPRRSFSYETLETKSK